VASSSSSRALAVYLDRRIITVLFLGFSSGLPLALTGATLTRWLSESGIDLKTIGLFALVSLPYGFKFCWAPLVDRLRLPVLTDRFGQRRGWALLTQFMLMLAIVAMGFGNPAEAPGRMAILALIVAFCSASQDIVIDAHRVEYLEERQQGAGNAIYVLGYRFGMMASGAGALYLAQILDWATAYAVMGGLIGVGVITVLLSPEPKVVVPPEAVEAERRIARWLAARPHLRGRRAALLSWLHTAVVAPFTGFMRRENWVLIILFIAFFKAADVISGQMTQPFYNELGFTKAEVASLTKVFGIWALVGGGLLGGALVGRLGVNKGLLIGGVLQMVSNLGYVVLAGVGHDLSALAAVVAVENVCSGIATTAFVAYLASLCDASYTATQYALLSSVYKIGGDLLAATSGRIAAPLGWTPFFVVSTVAGLPALLILAWLMRRTPAERPEPAVVEP
jgi:MFS transporter, PAT family, beta-lactamase induction signal transducer AmpG